MKKNSGCFSFEIVSSGFKIIDPPTAAADMGVVQVDMVLTHNDSVHNNELNFGIPRGHWSDGDVTW